MLFVFGFYMHWNYETIMHCLLEEIIKSVKTPQVCSSALHYVKHITVTAHNDLYMFRDLTNNSYVIVDKKNNVLCRGGGDPKFSKPDALYGIDFSKGVIVSPLLAGMTSVIYFDSDGTKRTCSVEYGTAHAKNLPLISFPLVNTQLTFKVCDSKPTLIEIHDTKSAKPWSAEAISRFATRHRIMTPIPGCRVESIEEIKTILSDAEPSMRGLKIEEIDGRVLYMEARPYKLLYRGERPKHMVELIMLGHKKPLLRANPKAKEFVKQVEAVLLRLRDLAGKGGYIPGIGFLKGECTDGCTPEQAVRSIRPSRVAKMVCKEYGCRSFSKMQI